MKSKQKYFLLNLVISISFISFSNAQLLSKIPSTNLDKSKTAGLYNKEKQKTGEWSYYRNDKSLFAEVNYLNGKFHGTHSVYWENGTLFQVSNYELGKLEGVSKKYFDDGVIAETRFYKNGLKDGEEKIYEHSGLIFRIKNFKDGLYHGQTIYFDDGKLFSREQYKNGKLIVHKQNFDWEGWFEDVDLRKKVEFELIVNEDETNAIFIIYEPDSYDDDETHVMYYWKGNVKIEGYKVLEDGNYDIIPSFDEIKVNRGSGVWKRYNSENINSGQATFENGWEVKRKTYFPNGKLSYESVLDGDVKMIKTYYQSGKLRSERRDLKRYKNKRFDDYKYILESKEYFEDGRVKKIQMPGYSSSIYFNKVKGKWQKYVIEYDSKAIRHGYQVARIADSGSLHTWYNDKDIRIMQGRKNSSLKEIGIWKYFDDEGKLLKEENYVNGKKQ
ncbi:toxin-antitoxin system YwqK family antitoxin [Urechidicola vernalis]|uniref:Toxin-antitoxin system YwqK family antitoxin n=1 Tax=Urechidicola vernalis TaxID=3075600 RepID=A0ABU2Y121_9FLAO|nr:hypothetical protein [Urechidicola sp. P050]MDT0551883.1 hypothetical protein [Urechidicola sp. P050]